MSDVNQIDEIYDYFVSVVKIVDPDLKVDGYVFENDDNASAVADGTYKILMNDFVTTLIDSSYETVFDVEIWTYKVSGTERVKDLNKAFCRAIEISAVAQDQRRINQLRFIKKVVNGSGKREKIAGDDNSARYKIQFSVTTYYSIE